MRCVGNIRLLRVIVAVLCAYAGLGYRTADASWLSQTMGEKSIYSLNKVSEASDDAISVRLYKNGVFETVNYKLSLK